jgi:recombination associated protein RdgC
MGLLSASNSVTRYTILGELEKPVMDTVYNGLVRHSIQEIDDDQQEKSVGWTSLENPYMPDFEGSSFVIGSYLVFSMRLDKKSIPAKVINKHYALEMTRLLEKSGREHLSRNEKRSLKENVTNSLSLRIPATPNVYDIIWHLEESWLWFFTGLKAANEALEELFKESFGVNLVRIFPYTYADLKLDLTDADRDVLTNLSPTTFME